MRRLPLISILLTVCIAASAQQERHIPVIRAQFPDTGFEMTDEQASELLGQAANYFTDQFAGSCDFVFDLLPVITLSESAEYYGRNKPDKTDALLHRAVQEICYAADEFINYKDYDCDNDGNVDCIYILFAGESEISTGNPDLIWPQQNMMSAISMPIYLQGKKIDCFCTSTESDSFLTFCHEYGHVLGLSDLYDTDGEASGGMSEALWGSLSLMDTGSGNAGTPPNFCAIELETLGLGTCEQLEIGDYELEPIGTSKHYLKAPTDNDGEFFLFECRDNKGWDASIGGSGLVIYHIDRSENPAGFSDYYRTNLTAYDRWRKEQINCRPDHQCADLCEADSTSSVSTVFFPQEGHVSFGSDTKPAFRSWNGMESSFCITGITRGTGGHIKFSVVEPVKITDMVVFQDAATLRWTTDEAIGKEAFTYVICTGDEGADTLKVASGIRCCTVEHLKPSSNYVIKIQARSSSGEAFSASINARTKAWRKELQPYIYLGSVSRGEDGRIQAGSHIPLRVCNAPDAAEVRWTLDGRAIDCNKDGYYEIVKPGLLKAEVLYEDGSTDILIKKIVLE